jgi:hypothetical protein
MVGSCRECASCKEELEQYCEPTFTATYNGPEPQTGDHTFGGYSSHIVVDNHFVLRIEALFDAPDEPNPKNFVRFVDGDGDRRRLCRASGRRRDRHGSHEREIVEHGSWRSMRDRIPLSQTGAQAPDGSECQQKHGNGRATVTAHKNLAVIRSDQDWTAAQGEEKLLCLDEIEPTLRIGKPDLRDGSAGISCYRNLYVHQICDT